MQLQKSIEKRERMRWHMRGHRKCWQLKFRQLSPERKRKQPAISILIEATVIAHSYREEYLYNVIVNNTSFAFAFATDVLNTVVCRVRCINQQNQIKINKLINDNAQKWHKHILISDFFIKMPNRSMTLRFANTTTTAINPWPRLKHTMCLSSLAFLSSSRRDFGWMTCAFWVVIISSRFWVCFARCFASFFFTSQWTPFFAHFIVCVFARVACVFVSFIQFFFFLALLLWPKLCAPIC